MPTVESRVRNGSSKVHHDEEEKRHGKLGINSIEVDRE